MTAKPKSKLASEDGGGKDLKRDQIVEAAVRIADAEGYQAVSMRRIASELGVGTMSLYHYVRTKGELLALMQDTIMSEMLIPEGELPADWREAFRQIANHTVDIHLNHPWIFDAMSDVDATAGPNVLRHVEQSLYAAETAGFEGIEAFEVITLVDDYAFGYAARVRHEVHSFTEEERRERIESVLDGMREELATDQYPRMAAFLEGDIETLMGDMESMEQDRTRFDRGLAMLLDGLEAERKQRKRKPRKR
jgi:AcrR family transcriptional regulator